MHATVQDDLRFAVHEATHAIECDVEGPASSENIHYSMMDYADSPAELWLFELRARAVEALVCQHFGYEYDLEHWVVMSSMEGIQNRLPQAAPEDSIPLVEKMMSEDVTKDLVDYILALKPEDPE